MSNLLVADHHDVVGSTVDIPLLHDDLHGGQAAVCGVEVDLTLEHRLDDSTISEDDIVGVGVNPGNYHIHIIGID